MILKKIYIQLLSSWFNSRFQKNKSHSIEAKLWPKKKVHNLLRLLEYKIISHVPQYNFRVIVKWKCHTNGNEQLRFKSHPTRIDYEFLNIYYVVQNTKKKGYPTCRIILEFKKKNKFLALITSHEFCYSGKT